MHRAIGIALCLLSCVLATPSPPVNGNADANSKGRNNFCSVVKHGVTALHEQRSATSFCSSYLKLSTVVATKTVTTTSSVTATATTTSTITAHPTTTTTSEATVTTTVESDVTTTVTTTTTSTSVVYTATFYTGTETETDTDTETMTATTTTTITTTTALPNCPSPDLMLKRDLDERGAASRPKCFSSYSRPAVISRACSCLSIPKPTSTRTVTDSTLNTSTRSSTITSTTTVPPTSTVTVVDGTATVTQTTTVTDTRSETSTETDYSSHTIYTVSTTTTTTTTTDTETSTATETVTRYTDFALLASNNNKFAAISSLQGYSHGTAGSSISGEGVYFSGADLTSAAGFSFAGDVLYHNSHNVGGYYYNQDDLILLINAQYAYPAQCTLATSGGATSGGPLGCPLNCVVSVGPFGFGNGNDMAHFEGAWGLQNSADQFTVYAVGMTV